MSRCARSLCGISYDDLTRDAIDAHLAFLMDHPETSKSEDFDSAQKLKVSDMIGRIRARARLARDEDDIETFYDATDDFFRAYGEDVTGALM